MKNNQAAPEPKLTVDQRRYPEMAAGGFSRDDHRMAFLTRVHAVLTPDMTVMDFGAGRGKWEDDPAMFRRELGRLKNKCRRVVGVDIDPAIMDNPQLDEKIHIQEGEALPFDDSTFDMILAFSAFEHFEDPGFYTSELKRVLKPDGWIIGWAPNRNGYVGLSARLIPGFLHEAILKLFEPRREDHDSFRPVYLLNSRKAFSKYFPEPLYQHMSYTYAGLPMYHGENIYLSRFWSFLFRFLPDYLQGYWMIIIKKAAV